MSSGMFYIFNYFIIAAETIKTSIMAVEILTPADLQTFREELMNDIRDLFKEHGIRPDKKWLKSPDVRRVLSISAGTLQQLRVNGSLPFTKFGGALYYDYDDIQKILNENKKQNHCTNRYISKQ